MSAILGVDISSWQPANMNMAAAKAEGISFIQIKASQGLYDDQFFAAHRANAAAAGLLVSAYHFLERGNGAAQADHFLGVLQRTGGLYGIGAQLDVELQTYNPNVGPTAQDVRDFLARWNALTNSRPIVIYTADWYWGGYLGGPTDLAAYPLWWASPIPGGGLVRDIFASGGNDGKGVTEGWFNKFGGWDKYAIRQFSGTATAAGVSPIDADCAFMSIQDLGRLWGISAPEPHGPTPPTPTPKPVPGRIAVDGVFGAATAKALQRWLGTAQDGVVGPITVKALQRTVGARQDGVWGNGTTAALQRYLNINERASLVVDGVFGPNTIKALQNWLNRHA